MTMLWRTVVLAAVASAGASPAAAQADTANRVVASLGACRAIADKEGRLACFDKAAADLEAAVRDKRVTIVDAQDIRKAKRSLFGFTLPTISLFGDNGPEAEDAEAFTEIKTTVASTRPGDKGRTEIRLADESGAVWETLDPMPFAPRAGQDIRIRKGSMGSYFLRVDGRTYRGRRLR